MIGLERFIYGVLGGKTVADTVEAILGAVYLDSGLKKVEEVMDISDLVSKARRLERILESDGFVMFDGKEVPLSIYLQTGSSHNHTHTKSVPPERCQEAIDGLYIGV